MTTVAIDFGTSNTIVALLTDKGGSTQTLGFKGISRTFKTIEGLVPVIPSEVYIQETGLAFGETVRKLYRESNDQSRLFRYVKSDLAADYRPPARQIAGKTYTSEAIAKAFLEHLWQQILAQNIQPTQGILTLPLDSFEAYHSWIKTLDFTNLKVVDEGTAAAYGYGITDPGSVVLVVDFGAGTLALKLISLTTPEPGNPWLKGELIAQSEAYVGGVDLDIWLAQTCLQRLGYSRSDLTPRCWDQVLQAAEQLKIQLSTVEEATIEQVPLQRLGDETPQSHNFHLTRREWEAILASQSLQSQLQEAVEEILAAALGKGITKDKMNACLLVGGGGQIPLVQQWLQQTFGQEQVQYAQSVTAVCHGALRVSEILSTENILSSGYVLRLWDAMAKKNYYFDLFEKGSVYPSQHPRALRLQVAQDAQDQIQLDLGELRETMGTVEVTYNEQGQIDSSKTSGQREFCPLGRQDQHACILPLTPTGETKVDRIEVTFTLDTTGKLQVTGQDLLTQRTLIPQETLTLNPNLPIPSTSKAVLGGLAGTRQQLGITVEETEKKVQSKVNWGSLTLRYTLTGHEDGITAVKVTPDGQTLISGSRDRTLRLWERSTGTWLRTLTGHTDAISSLSISPDSKLLASGGLDKTVRLWHVGSGHNLHTDMKNHQEAVFAVAFSEDGQTLASGGWESKILLRQVYGNGLPRKVGGHQGGVNGILFCPDGETYVTCGDNFIKLWRQSSGECLHTFAGHRGVVLSLAVSPNGQLLASGGGIPDGTIKVWNLETGSLLQSFSPPSGGVFSLSFSPDGTTLASGGSGQIYLWNGGTGTLIQTLSGHQGEVNGVAFSPVGETLVSGSSDRTVKIWTI